jgi:hypothetical protein
MGFHPSSHTSLPVYLFTNSKLLGGEVYSNSPDRPVSFEICEGHGCQGNLAKLQGFIWWTAQMSFKLLKILKLSGLPNACSS